MPLTDTMPHSKYFNGSPKKEAFIKTILRLYLLKKTVSQNEILSSMLCTARINMSIVLMIFSYIQGWIRFQNLFFFCTGDGTLGSCKYETCSLSLSCRPNPLNLFSYKVLFPILKMKKPNYATREARQNLSSHKW